MATAVELPQFGNTVEECLIARWISRKGDAVSAGDVILEIETDKTTFEVQAPIDGVLLETFFDEGALVPVFTNVCVIGREGDDIDAFRPTQSPNRPIQSPNHPIPQSPNSSITQSPDAASATPRAMRLAREHRLDIASITGTGPGGRILERDVAAASRATPAPGLSGARGVIARRMRHSLASTAQFTMHASANATRLLTLRARMKRGDTHLDVNINELVTFCVVQALRDMPDLNVEFIEGAIVKHTDVHLGFACDTPRGLMVPVIRNAHTLSLGHLAQQVRALTAQAVEGRISPDDLKGGTFTVSNLGGLGIEAFTPIVNPPQVAILGIDAIRVKPVRNNGQIEFVDVIGLSLTCDHQVIDGAPGARFLQVVKEKIEHAEVDCH